MNPNPGSSNKCESMQIRIQNTVLWLIASYEDLKDIPARGIGVTDRKIMHKNRPAGKKEKSEEDDGNDAGPGSKVF
jgi:hypothetical protein